MSNKIWVKIPPLVLLSILLFGCDKPSQPPHRDMGPTHVDIVTVTKQTMKLSNELPGRISAFKEAEVRPQVSGIVKARLFQEGQNVKAGDVLYLIDPTTYQASVNNKKAQLEKAIADQSATQKTLERYTELLNTNLTSQQSYDDAVSANQGALAEISIKKADLENANTLLSYTKVKAPISGRIGLSQVSEGTLVSAEQATLLATISQYDQVYVDMTQSSTMLYKIRKEFKAKRISSKAKSSIPVKITLEDGTEYNQEGYLQFADTKVSSSTGSVTLRAIIPNPDLALLPGMFVRAHISMPEAKEYILLPQSLISRAPNGAPYVYRVNSQNQAEKVLVTLGSEQGNQWIITHGINVGDRVISSNLMKVRDKQTVVIDDATNHNESPSQVNAKPQDK